MDRQELRPCIVKIGEETKECRKISGERTIEVIKKQKRTKDTFTHGEVSHM